MICWDDELLAKARRYANTMYAETSADYSASVEAFCTGYTKAIVDEALVRIREKQTKAQSDAK